MKMLTMLGASALCSFLLVCTGNTQWSDGESDRDGQSDVHDGDHGTDGGFASPDGVGGSPDGGSHISQQWEPRGIGGGGALFSATISPHDSDLIFMATDMSMVFRSNDFGTSWRGLSFTALQGGVNSHVRFTSSPTTLYAIHQDGDDLLTPVRSLDGAASWSPLPEDPTYGEAFYLFADPNSTDRLVVSNYETIFFSNNGGQSWVNIYSTSDENGIVIAGTFWNGNDVFVATSDGLLVSSNSGDSFALSAGGGIPGSEAMVSFSGAHQGGETRFFAVTLDRGDVWAGVTGADYWGFGGAYRMDWGSSSWTEVSSGLSQDDRPFFVAMAQNDVNTAYLAGSNTETGDPIVFKTTNGGQSWTAVFNTGGNENVATGWAGSGGDLEWYWPEVALSLDVCPTDPDRVVITDFGFVHVTSNGGVSWRQAYVVPATENPAGQSTPQGRYYQTAGVENTSVWWLHWASQSVIMAAFTDVSGLRSEDGGLSWCAGSSLNLPHDNTYHIVQHPDSSTLYAATSSVHDIYQSTYLTDASIDDGDGAIVISNDAGASWQVLRDMNHPVVWLAIDPNDSETMVASVVHRTDGGIYVTHNLSAGSGASWSRLPAPQRTEGHPFNIHVLDDGSLLSSWSGRMDASETFTASSGVFLSTDGGQTWSDRSDSNMTRWTRDVVVDPHDSSQNTWYVGVFSHWGAEPNEVGGVYRTTDRGVSWTRISDLYRVASITIDPNDQDVAYVTTETRGLWRTDNMTSNSPTFALDAGYPFRHPLRVFFNPYDEDEIWVTSFGGGLYVRSDGD